MNPRFAQLPKSLQERSRAMTLGGGVPALVAHPDWDAGIREPIPAVVWMHGRTVSKELDPGRYLRWIRAGIGAIALDLPGHGDRYSVSHQSPGRTLDVIEQAAGEIDGVLESIAGLGVFDMGRLAIGGMSAGGMVTLNRLCSPHPFLGASVECTTGSLRELYFPEPGSPGRSWVVKHDESRVAELDPIEHLDGFRPIPLLAMHNEGDELVPIEGQRRFLDALRAHYTVRGADPGLIEMTTFTDTGAPQEHSGFGRRSNDAKNQQLGFLQRLFGMERP